MPRRLVFSAMRESLALGYSLKSFRSDLAAGLVVGLVAVPLGMALAIASGVEPKNGLYTVIIAGALTALLGGSRWQVSGPTAAFVVLLVPIVHHHGLGGLLLSGFMAGIILIFLGVTRLGALVRYIPHPVTTGFTTGIAVVIATIQLKDFLGLPVIGSPESYLARVAQYAKAFPEFSPIELTIGMATLWGLLLWPKLHRKIPSPLVVIPVVSLAVAWLTQRFPGTDIATVASRYGEIPRELPSLSWPWSFSLPGELGLSVNYKTIKELLPSAFAIALLGAIESLLSAVIADGMKGTRHNPNAELTALGISNLVVPFFGGIAATGAIARTSTNIRFGARTPIAAILHAVFALIVLLIAAPLVSHMPMAALAALLLVVAYNMSDLRHFFELIRTAPRSDVAVLLTVFGLTVLFDMVVGVVVGFVLAALLFMKRMSDLTEGHSLVHDEEKERDLPVSHSKKIVFYEIAGPLFFGAAEKAMGALDQIGSDVRVVVLLFERVPTIDATGIAALSSALERLERSRRGAVICEASKNTLRLLKRAKVQDHKNLRFSDNPENALKCANELIVSITSIASITAKGAHP